jgi:ABC-type cobalamin/Fe3+-siderophores transport system ATPase subunit
MCGFKRWRKAEAASVRSFPSVIKPPDMIILDEPTNNLDLQNVEIYQFHQRLSWNFIGDFP